MTVKLLSVRVCATAAVAAEPKPLPVGSHVWDSAALVRCSSPYQREVIADPQARSGQGIAVLGYADYSVIFGFRGYDFGRRFPDCLDWRTQNDKGFVWLGFDGLNMGLNSPLRAEDDSRTDVKVTGVSRTADSRFPCARQGGHRQPLGVRQAWRLRPGWR